MGKLVTKRMKLAGCVTVAALLMSPGTAWAVVPPDFTVTVTDETGEPIPDISITVEIPRKVGKPRKVTRKLPRRPRRNHVGDNAKRIFKHPPRRRDVSLTARVPGDADCEKPLMVHVRMGARSLGRWLLSGWCEDRDRLFPLRLAPSPFFARDLSGGGDASERRECAE